MLTPINARLEIRLPIYLSGFTRILVRPQDHLGKSMNFQRYSLLERHVSQKVVSAAMERFSLVLGLSKNGGR